MRSATILLIASSIWAADEAAKPTALMALPSSVSRSSNLWFENGKVRGGQDSLQISLAAKMTERLRIVDIDSVEIIEAVGDDGKPITAHEHGGNGGGGGEPGELNISLSLNPPAASVRMIRSLVFSAKAKIAAEGLRRTSLKPAKDWIAKRMRIEGIAGAEVELENLGSENLALGMTPVLEQAIENLSFLTAAGDEIDQRGTSDNQEPGWVVRTINVVLPPDGSIRLDLRQTMGERSFIITAKDIPIALPDRGKEPVGVLKTEVVKPDADDEPAAAPAIQILVPPKPGF